MSASTYLLDTNTCSYIAQGNSATVRREWIRLSGGHEPPSAFPSSQRRGALRNGQACRATV
jgi:hypothetical protein